MYTRYVFWFAFSEGDAVKNGFWQGPHASGMDTGTTFIRPSIR